MKGLTHLYTVIGGLLSICQFCVFRVLVVRDKMYSWVLNLRVHMMLKCVGNCQLVDEIISCAKMAFKGGFHLNLNEI